jgi:hypothetical protein
MRVPPRVGRRRIVTDEPNNLLPAGPGGLGRLPLLEERVLGSDLPFEGALGLVRPVLLAPQSPYFRHSRSFSPSKTPD